MSFPREIAAIYQLFLSDFFSFEKEKGQKKTLRKTPFCLWGLY